MSTKPKGLSGFTVVKNALSRDYCIRECVESMFAVCDQVLIADMGSDDGTWEMLSSIASTNSKCYLTLTRIRDWTQERANPDWWTSAINEARQRLDHSHMLQLDADEVLSDDPETHAAIRHAVEHTNAFAFDRLNFCGGPDALIPEGECVGRWVTRIGPSHLFLPSDEPHYRGEVHILDMAFNQPQAKIFHVGFLRKPEAFYAKARVVLGAFFGNYDERLVQAENEKGRSPMSYMPWFNRLTPYRGPYPASVRKWMEERGYHVP